VDLSEEELSGAAILSFGFAFTGIIECTFSRCVSYNGDGGAVWLGTYQMVVDRCCGRGCSCFERGQFMGFENPLGTGTATVTARVHLSSALECAPQSDLDDIGPWVGGIYFSIIAEATVQYANFTACFLTAYWGGTGTAICLAESGTATLTFLTVAECSGGVAIDNDERADGSRIDYANFYANVVPGDAIPLIQSASYGLSLLNCVFHGNELDGQILGFTETIEIPFRVYGCVFSGSFPSSAGVELMTGANNKENVETASIRLPQLSTGLCQHAESVPTPSQSPRPSAAMTPVETPTPAFAPTELRQTAGFKPTPQPRATQAAAASDNLLSSRAFQATGELIPHATPTESPTPSVTVTDSPVVTPTESPGGTPVVTPTGSPARTPVASPEVTPIASPAVTALPLQTTPLPVASANPGPPSGENTGSGSIGVIPLAAAGAGAVIIIVGIVLFLVFCRKKATSAGLVEQDGLDTDSGLTQEGIFGAEDFGEHQYDNPLAETIVAGVNDE
jgi:hypothetical protein